MDAICTDLSQTNASGVKNLDSGFDLIYALLAFHHLKNPETMLNKYLKENYLNPGGRVLIMDYEQDPTKQIFHPIHLIKGEHYEYDGFIQEEIIDWFKKGNLGNSLKKWDLETLNISKVPF